MFRSMLPSNFGEKVYVCKVYIGDTYSIQKEQNGGYLQMVRVKVDNPMANKSQELMG
jgi:hypothetical protein